MARNKKDNKAANSAFQVPTNKKPPQFGGNKNIRKNNMNYSNINKNRGK